MKQFAQSGKLTPANRERAEQIAENEYNFWQGKKIESLIAPFIGPALGRGAPGQRIPGASRGRGAAPAAVNDNVVSNRSIKLPKTMPPPALIPANVNTPPSLVASFNAGRAEGALARPVPPFSQTRPMIRPSTTTTTTTTTTTPTRSALAPTGAPHTPKRSGGTATPATSKQGTSKPALKREAPPSPTVKQIPPQPQRNASPKALTFDKEITWAAPQKGTGQTYKVYQRNDIDWNMVRTGGDKRFIGKTNTEAARKGLPPQLKDDSFATLHHIGQDARGSLVEASTSYHGIGKQGQNILHSQFGRNKPHPNFPINRSNFNIDTKEYWKMRVREYDKQ